MSSAPTPRRFEVVVADRPVYTAESPQDAVRYLHTVPANAPVRVTDLSLKSEVPEIPFPVASVPFLFPIVLFGGMELPQGGYTVSYQGGEARDLRLSQILCELIPDKLLRKKLVPIVLRGPSGRAIGEFNSTHYFQRFVESLRANECALSWYDAQGRRRTETVCTPEDFLRSQAEHLAHSTHVSLLRSDGEWVFRARQSTCGECVAHLVNKYRISRV